ncbi:unnamed protein product [Onchocerca ochengi]|uniref:G-protein alpha subunit n=1 Tax=Onchocerca ochengi TaxID=42157 RepID=A0A182EFJ5_ONCOC|nr:unnamed protein product [Onchocerca ochengi]
MEFWLKDIENFVALWTSVVANILDESGTNSTNVEDECVTIFTQLCNNFTLKKSHFIVLFNKKDVFDAQKRPQLNGPPPGGADTAFSVDSISSLSLIKAKFLNHLTRKIYQHTVSLLYRNTFEASVMECISEIAAKNRAVAPM